MISTPRNPDLLVLVEGDHVTALRVSETDVRYLVRVPTGLPLQASLASSVLAKLVQADSFERVLVVGSTAKLVLGPAIGAKLVTLPSVELLERAFALHRSMSDEPMTVRLPIPEKRTISSV